MYYRGGNGEQAAAALQVPVGTIKSRVYRALRMLKAALEQQGVAVSAKGELATSGAGTRVAS
jgi:DNA-directed RNA polymerase specialized sigma24 family protein